LRQAVAISEQLVKTEPANVDWQYGLGDNHDALGRALDAGGKLPEALSELQQGLTIRQRLADGDPENGDYQNEVFLSLLSLSDLYRHDHNRQQAIAMLSKALALLEPVAARDPGSGLWQGNLSTIYQRLGDLYVGEGDREKAADAFQHDLALREKLAEANPERDEWQQYLANSYNRMGDVRRMDKQYDEALEWYRKALAIRERLAPAVAGNAEWQSLLAGEHILIARVLVQEGKKEEGAASYQSAVGIFARLAELDPGNVAWEQTMTTALGEMATVLARLDGRLPEAIEALQKAAANLTKLVAADSSFAPRRYNLAVIDANLGDLLVTANRREDALATFQRSADLLERLITEDGRNSNFKHVFSDVTGKAASLLDGTTHRDEAISLYRKCLSVREKLAVAEPQKSWWQIGSAIVLIRLGELGDDPEARFTRALAILQELDAAGELPDNRKGWLNAARSRLSTIHGQRARQALYNGDLSTALSEMSISLHVNPSDAYCVLWLHIIRARIGDDDRDELAANAARLDKTVWPWPVVTLFTSAQTPELVRADALSAKDEKTRSNQMCEADFYTGVFQVEKGATAQARQLLAAAVKECPPQFIEYEGAKEELKRLELAVAPVR
jgi:tetratricopeptide (TPR) repeat protein